MDWQLIVSMIGVGIGCFCFGGGLANQSATKDIREIGESAERLHKTFERYRDTRDTEVAELRKQLDAANEELAFDSRVQSLQEQLSVVMVERDQLRLQVEANDEFDGRDFAARHDSIGVVDRTFEDHERG